MVEDRADNDDDEEEEEEEEEEDNGIDSNCDIVDDLQLELGLLYVYNIIF